MKHTTKSLLSWCLYLANHLYEHVTLIKPFKRLQVPCGETAGRLFIKHNGDKGEDWLTGSIQESRVFHWLQLWSWLINIYSIACNAWKTQQRLEFQCCIDRTRNKTALEGFTSRQATFGQGKRERCEVSAAVWCMKNQGSMHKIYGQVKRWILIPWIVSVTFPFLSSSFLNSQGFTNQFRMLCRVNILNWEAKSDLSTLFLSYWFGITKACRYLQHTDIWTILLVPVVS